MGYGAVRFIAARTYYNCFTQPERLMTVTVRQLAHRTGEVLRQVQQERRRVLVTSNGRPVAVLMPVDEEELLDRALEALVPSDEEVTREIVEGGTRSLSEVAEELGL
jgi:prevent-host-death family protein